MTGWVRASQDPSGETVFLNLALAVRMERRPGAGYTTVEFLPPARSQSIKEAPDQLIAQFNPPNRVL